MLLVIASTGLAIAQDFGTPPSEAPVDVPAEPPVAEAPVAEEFPVVQEPPVVEQPPVVPTESEPVAPAPTIVPPAPTLVPTVAPTPAPIPVVSFSEAVSPECVLTVGQPPSVAQGSGVEYTCKHSVQVAGKDVVPASIGATWTMSAAGGNGWSVSLLPPVNDPSVETPEWTASGQQTSFTFVQNYPVGATVEASSFDTNVTIQFRLRVERPACSTDVVDIRLDHAITVSSPGAMVTATTPASQPLLVTPSLKPIPTPSMAFDGPLSFGEVGVDADGVTTGVRAGTVSLTVSGLDQACGQYVVRVGASPMTNESGNVLEGSELVLVSVNGQPVSDQVCDLVAGCRAVVLTAGPGTNPMQIIRLGIELRMPEHPGVGSYGTSLTASLHAP